MTFSVIVLMLVRMIDEIAGSQLHYVLTPFKEELNVDLASGISNELGINTALMLMAVALSQVFLFLNKPSTSQTFAFIGLFLPSVAFIGYAYSVSSFFGEMSLTTATIGYALSLSALSLTAKHGLVRALLSPHFGGRLSRIQVSIAIFVPTILGYLFIKTLQHSTAQSTFGLFIVTLCWVSFILVGISAIYNEKVDSERRNMERLLLEAANQDALTRLPNRRKFFEESTHEFDRSLRTGKLLWVMMIDIDHFKTVNDKAGHDIGDKVLVAVGNTIKQSVRKIDVVGRIGGEEFAVVLTDIDTSQKPILRIAECIRENVEKIQIDEWTEHYGPVTVSIGLASSTSTSCLQQVLKMADKSLYHAKHSGRNRVSFNQAVRQLQPV